MKKSLIIFYRQRKRFKRFTLKPKHKQYIQLCKGELELIGRSKLEPIATVILNAITTVNTFKSYGR